MHRYPVDGAPASRAIHCSFNPRESRPSGARYSAASPQEWILRTYLRRTAKFSQQLGRSRNQALLTRGMASLIGASTSSYDSHDPDLEFTTFMETVSHGKSSHSSSVAAEDGDNGLSESPKSQISRRQVGGERAVIKFGPEVPFETAPRTRNTGMRPPRNRATRGRFLERNATRGMGPSGRAATRWVMPRERRAIREVMSSGRPAVRGVTLFGRLSNRGMTLVRRPSFRGTAPGRWRNSWRSHA